MSIGFFTALLYLITIFYATSNLDDVLSAPFFPLAQIYAQATATNGGTVGLLFLIFVPVVCTAIGCYITAGRCLWTLGRDEAVPFSGTIGIISQRFKNPFNATLAVGIFSTILGAIQVGSTAAFNAFVGSFAVLSTLSYLAAILPFIFTRRFSKDSQVPGPYNNNMRPGWFQMHGALGYTVNIISCLYIVVFVVIFCFPYSMPVTAVNMNYASLITGGISIFAAIWWFVKGGKYVGPQAMVHEDAHIHVDQAVVTGVKIYE
jgi:choline transport protein